MIRNFNPTNYPFVNPLHSQKQQLFLKPTLKPKPKPVPKPKPKPKPKSKSKPKQFKDKKPKPEPVLEAAPEPIEIPSQLAPKNESSPADNSRMPVRGKSGPSLELSAATKNATLNQDAFLGRTDNFRMPDIISIYIEINNE